MTAGKLSQYFNGVAAKRLRAVETDRKRSNQHELNGVTQLKRILGSGRREFRSRFLYLDPDTDKVISDDGFVTWYDSRENHPERSEYRLYLPETEVYSAASEGDLVIIGVRPDNTVLVIVVPSGSSMENQLIWLFDLSGDLNSFVVQEDWTERDLGLAGRTILEEIGIEAPLIDEDYLGLLLDRFGEQFPPTKVFSNYARQTLPSTSSLDDPDSALLAWIEREEMLFRTLEAHIVKKRLLTGFEDDVDGFISYSLSVQNRRKSRIGHAFELHLAFLFDEHNLSFSRGAVTENRSKPDFLFPGIDQYMDEKYPLDRLTMLGVKSSCKDRWRQVLSEAARLTERHLITLEPGISGNQTHEMRSHSLQLVVPAGLQTTYRADQRSWLMSVADFIREVSRRTRTASV